MRDRRARLKAAGICVICGAQPAQPEKTMCAACQANAYARVKARRAQRSR
jgi:NMD protein affecting ribosome stability and mRNA decay